MKGYHEFVEINAKDETNSNALTYAACLGHQEIVQLLLKHGAFVSEKEATYISMMALSNGHDGIASMLKDHARTARALEIDDDDDDGFFSDSESCLSTILEEDEEGMYEDDDLLEMEDINQVQNVNSRKEPVTIRIHGLEGDLNDSFLKIDSAIDVHSERKTDDDSSTDDLESSADSLHGTEKQVEVKDSTMNQILQVIIKQIVPSKKEFYPLGANCIYVMAKKYIDAEMSLNFFDLALEMLNIWIDENSDNMYTLLYWITNAFHLLAYLKNDLNLMAESIEIQLELTEIVQKICVKVEQLLLSQLEPILQSAILDYKADQATAGLKYDDSLSFFLTSATRLIALNLSKKHTPNQVIDVFKHFLTTIEQTHISPLLVKQLIDRVCLRAGSILIDLVVGNRSFCCKARARQIQLNLSKVVQWIREHAEPLGNPDILASFLKLNHILQFIQYAPIFQDLDGFQHLIASLTAIDRKIIREIMGHFRFEVGESKFSSAIVSWVGNGQEEQETRHSLSLDALDLDHFHLPVKQYAESSLIPTIPTSVLDLLYR